MPKGRDRMSAQDKTLGQFRKVINQSGSLGDNRELSLSEQLKRANKNIGQPPISDPDEAFYKRLNSKAALALRV